MFHVKHPLRCCGYGRPVSVLRQRRQRAGRPRWRCLAVWAMFHVKHCRYWCGSA